MRRSGLDDLTVAEIMTNWPSTIRLFVAWRLHCVGCPISPFHTLVDAAAEHGREVEGLSAAVAAEIDRLTAGRA